VAEAKLPGRSIDLTFLTEENPFNLLKNKPSITPGSCSVRATRTLGRGIGVLIEQIKV
jgi:general secretion pathway protein G